MRWTNSKQNHTNKKMSKMTQSANNESSIREAQGANPSSSSQKKAGQATSAIKPLLKVEDLRVAYGPHTIVDKVSFEVSEGQWLMLVGPNGAGKSTIVNAITQGTPATGSILYKGKDVSRMKSVERARQIGILAQNHYVGYNFTIREVVSLGRYAYTPSFFAERSDEETDAVDRALELTGLTEMQDRSVLHLSGGEQQRAFLAQVLAQNPSLLLLDEPTNHLDLIYQKQVFSMVQDWLTEPGRAVVSVVHDLSLAKRYGTHAMVLHSGHISAYGEACDVLDSKYLDEVYGMDVAQWMREMYGQWG